MQAEKRYINRDAVAAVLGHVDAGCPPQEALVLDIRRHDERSMYGSIPGMHFRCLLHDYLAAWLCTAVSIVHGCWYITEKADSMLRPHAR